MRYEYHCKIALFYGTILLAWNWICNQFILLCIAVFFLFKSVTWSNFYNTINAICNLQFIFSSTLIQRPNHNILDNIFYVLSLLNCNNSKYHFDSNTFHRIYTGYNNIQWKKSRKSTVVPTYFHKNHSKFYWKQ